MTASIGVRALGAGAGLLVAGVALSSWWGSKRVFIPDTRDPVERLKWVPAHLTPRERDEWEREIWKEGVDHVHKRAQALQVTKRTD